MDYCNSEFTNVMHGRGQYADVGKLMKVLEGPAVCMHALHKLPLKPSACSDSGFIYTAATDERLASFANIYDILFT